MTQAETKLAADAISNFAQALFARSIAVAEERSPYGSYAVWKYANDAADKHALDFLFQAGALAPPATQPSPRRSRRRI